MTVLRYRLGPTVILVAAIVCGWVSGAAAGALNLSWIAPTTNADGTPLSDLAGYRVYVGSTVPPCPSPSFEAVASSTSAPMPGRVVDHQVTGLTQGITYTVVITAVDFTGNESACTAPVSGVARADVSVSPRAIDFGGTPTGGVASMEFTIANSTGASAEGTASVGPPFSIVDGSSFSLAPDGNRTVVVEFRPTVAGSFAGNVNFNVNGDSVSRAVTGSSSLAGDSPAPRSVPSSTSSGPLRVLVTQPSNGADISGAAWAVLWVEGTRGEANTFTLAVDGTTIGSETTSASGPVTIPWNTTSVSNGRYTLTAVVRDTGGNFGSTSITVTVRN
jgi:hypothetical protein